jgi:hypothetical protein
MVVNATGWEIGMLEHTRLALAQTLVGSLAERETYLSPFLLVRGPGQDLETTLCLFH